MTQLKTSHTRLYGSSITTQKLHLALTGLPNLVAYEILFAIISKQSSLKDGWELVPDRTKIKTYQKTHSHPASTMCSHRLIFDLEDSLLLAIALPKRIKMACISSYCFTNKLTKQPYILHQKSWAKWRL